MSAPVRTTGSTLAAVVNWIVPGPWPELPDVMLSQLESDVAVHWHSRSVVTATDPVPPAAGRVEADGSNATVHLLSVVGVVTVLPEEPHAVRPSAQAKIPNAGAKYGTRCWSNVSPTFRTAVL